MANCDNCPISGAAEQIQEHLGKYELEDSTRCALEALKTLFELESGDLSNPCDMGPKVSMDSTDKKYWLDCADDARNGLIIYTLADLAFVGDSPRSAEEFKIVHPEFDIDTATQPK